MTNSMQPIPFGTPYRSPRQISRVALAAAASVIMILAWAFTNGHVGEAGASEFYPNPTLSIIDGCEAGVFTYNVGMYNSGATDGTTFTVISQIGGAPQKVDVYPIGPGGLQWVKIIMPEGVVSTVHVINPQGKGVDDLGAPTPDCVADVNTQLLQVCDAETDAASVLYEWVNTSSTAAHIALKFNGAIVKEGDYQWPQPQEHFEVPVAEGDVITASILVDGITTNLIDETIDCVPEPPITTTTIYIPPTTTSTTVPPTTTSTTVYIPPTTTSTTVPPTTTSTTIYIPPTTTSTTVYIPPTTTSTTVPPTTTTSTTVKPTTTTSTTVPSTTSTTVKATTTSTSTTVKPTTTTTSTLPVSTTSSTVVPSTVAPVNPTTIAPAVVEGVTVVRQVQQPTSRLAVTGSGSSKLAGLAIVMMAVGLAMWVASRRLRARFAA